jgi:nucleoside-diphosphate-sugar epimerase
LFSISFERIFSHPKRAALSPLLATRLLMLINLLPDFFAVLNSTDRIAALGWSATHSLEQAVAETVAWYGDHADWWRTLVSEAEGLYAD